MAFITKKHIKRRTFRQCAARRWRCLFSMRDPAQRAGVDAVGQAKPRSSRFYPHGRRPALPSQPHARGAFREAPPLHNRWRTAEPNDDHERPWSNRRSHRKHHRSDHCFAAATSPASAAEDRGSDAYRGSATIDQQIARDRSAKHCASLQLASRIPSFHLQQLRLGPIAASSDSISLNRAA